MDFPIIRRPQKPDPDWDPHNNAVTNGFAYRIPNRPAVNSRSTQQANGASSGGWIVQKYGGTSVGKVGIRIAEEIVKPGLTGQRLAIVCSARSTGVKTEGTTTRLLRAARDVGTFDSQSNKYESIVESIRKDHIEAGRRDVPTENGDEGANSILSDYEDHVNSTCKRLLQILQSAQILNELTFQTKDMVMSVGEQLACRYMTALLQSRGVSAAYVDMSEIVDFVSTNRRGGLGEGFYEKLAVAMAEKVRSVSSEPGTVPVITGFFGKVPGGLLEEIGRGYTDLCAALIGIGLKATELQIWKEVDGIFTADPSKVAAARLLHSVSPSEAAELTFYGSEVIHPFTMDQVIRAQIPIRIKNVVNPKNEGTVILPDPKDFLDRRPGSLFRDRSSSNLNRSLSPASKLPSAVTIKKGIALLNVHSKKRTRAHGFLSSIFHTLDTHGLSIDLISSSEVHVSLALHSEDRLLSGGGREELSIESQALRNAVEDLSTWGDIDLVPNMAILSLVGRYLRSNVGVAGRFFSCLGKHGINIEMISQGASEINISCVIDEAQAEMALNVVHTDLFTFPDS